MTWLDLEFELRAIEAHIELHKEIRLPQYQRYVDALDLRERQTNWRKLAHLRGHEQRHPVNVA